VPETDGENRDTGDRSTASSAETDSNQRDAGGNGSRARNDDDHFPPPAQCGSNEMGESEPCHEMYVLRRRGQDSQNGEVSDFVHHVEA